MSLSKIKHSFTFTNRTQLKYLKIKIIKNKKISIVVSRNWMFSTNLNKWSINHLMPLGYFSHNYFDTKRLLNLFINQKLNKPKLTSKKNLIENQFLNLL